MSNAQLQKYKYTITQLHKYTITVYNEVSERPSGIFLTLGTGRKVGKWSIPEKSIKNVVLTSGP